MFTLEKGWHLKDTQDKRESRIETLEMNHLVSHLLIAKTQRTKVYTRGSWPMKRGELTDIN